MGPELIAFATSAVAQATLESLFQAIGNEAVERVSAVAASAFKRWRTQSAAKAVYDRSKQLRKVKTIWQVEKEVDLIKFYYPSKVKNQTHAPKEVHRLRDFAFEGNLVIRGIVGQGKSTFLRYLAARELDLAERIPLFVELRRLARGQSVVAAAIEEMKDLGLAEANEEIFEYLSKESRLALLLDGFDELGDEQTSAVVLELEQLSVRNPNLRMLATSRPENAIERSPHFRVFDLAPLGPGEYANVVARITHDTTLAEEIVNGINKSHAAIAILLTTPLMVSLLVVQFRVGHGIPENRVAFFDPLFMLLLQRHDGAKAGFKRKRKSKLSDSQLLTFFNCLCFITRKDGVSTLRESTLNAAASRALRWVNLDATPDDALDDIRDITNLLLRDGLDEYRFLHKSVQEFHAACFVRDQPDALAGEFYSAMQRRWSDWGQELEFLRVIHQDRFDRYFAVPMLDQVVSTLPGAPPVELGRALIGRLTARVTLHPSAEFRNLVYPHDPVGWCLMNYFDGSALFECLGDASVRVSSGGTRAGTSRDYTDVPVREVLAALTPEHQPAIDAEALRLGTRITGALEERKRRMHTLDERKGLFDL